MDNAARTPPISSLPCDGQCVVLLDRDEARAILEELDQPKPPEPARQ